MSYFAEPNHIEYDAWFDENVDPLDLVNYSDEKEFSDSVHFKYHKMSTRNLTIGLFCVEVNENDEIEATNLLKSEFPRGSKVKIKPFGFKDNVLLAKVFNIKGTKEMTELLVAKDLTSEICPS